MRKLLVIVGPTASGKTQLGIDLAKRFDGEVISVDSRQVYRGMDVGTGKVEGDRVRRVEGSKEGIGTLFANEHHLVVDGIPHWGIDLVDPDAEYSVADFKKYAEEKIVDISKRGKLPILVGGTGLWVRAVVDDLNLTETARNDELRDRLEARHLDDLFAEYKRLDPDGAELIDRQNKRRVVRALEVTIATGKPFSAQLKRGTSKYDLLEIGILVDRDVLNARINDRVEVMVATGLVNEVRRLRDKYGCDNEAMTGIGYRQVCRWLELSSAMGADPAGGRGRHPERGISRSEDDGMPRSRGPMASYRSLADAIEETKKATRAYAKRQMTWFRRDDRVRWIERSGDLSSEASAKEDAFEIVESWVTR